jgi:hypothetical protein
MPVLQMLMQSGVTLPALHTKGGVARFCATAAPLPPGLDASSLGKFVRPFQLVRAVCGGGDGSPASAPSAGADVLKATGAAYVALFLAVMAVQVGRVGRVCGFDCKQARSRVWLGAGVCVLGGKALVHGTRCPSLRPTCLSSLLCREGVSFASSSSARAADAARTALCEGASHATCKRPRYPSPPWLCAPVVACACPAPPPPQALMRMWVVKSHAAAELSPAECDRAREKRDRVADSNPGAALLQVRAPHPTPRHSLSACVVVPKRYVSDVEV